MEAWPPGAQVTSTACVNVRGAAAAVPFVQAAGVGDSREGTDSFSSHPALQVTAGVVEPCQGRCRLTPS